MTMDIHNQWQSASDRRSVVGRVLWGLLAMATGVAGVILVGLGTFAPPEMESVQIDGWETYHVDMMRIAYLVACGLLPLSGLGVWKASHRSGLGFWRSTGRPALMAASTALIGSGLTSSAYFFPGKMQLLGLSAATAGAVGLLFFWILRGPSFTLTPGDGYWNKAFATVFALAGACASVGSVGSFKHWSREGYEVGPSDELFRTVRVHQERWDSESEYMRSKVKSYQVPKPVYNPTPMGAALMTLLAVGCFSEARYRLGLSRRAQKVAFDKLF